MKKVVARFVLLLMAACVVPLAAAFGQSEWTYIVTGKSGQEGLPVYYLSGEQAFTLKKGDVVEVSAFHDDFPAKDEPGKTRRVAIITADMEDYVIYLDEEGLIVPKSEYRYERLFSGLGSIVGKNPAQNYAIPLIGVLYLLMLLYAARGVVYVRPRVERLRGIAGGIFLALYVAVLCAETYCLLTFSDPMWFLRMFRVGFFKGLLLLLPMIVYLYLKYTVTLLALYPIRNSHRLEDTEFDAPHALLVAAVGTWILLSMSYWEALWVPYAMGVVAVATLVGVVYVLRRTLRVAGLLRAVGILGLVLLAGATLSYVACEVLAVIVQLVVFGFMIYALFSAASMKSSPSMGGPAEHETFVDDDGNFHDLYRQPDGSYVDYGDNSHWNKRETGSSRRFDRIGR